MDDRELRELLQEIIDDVDEGRVEVEKPRTLRIAGPILAAAIGIAGCAGAGTTKTPDPPDNRPRTQQVDAGAKQGEPQPPAMRRDPAPVPAYGVPVTRPTRPKPMRDPGPVAEYAAPIIDR